MGGFRGSLKGKPQFSWFPIFARNIVSRLQVTFKGAHRPLPKKGATKLGWYRDPTRPDPNPWNRISFCKLPNRQTTPCRTYLGPSTHSFQLKKELRHWRSGWARLFRPFWASFGAGTKCFRERKHNSFSTPGRVSKQISKLFLFHRNDWILFSQVDQSIGGVH